MCADTQHTHMIKWNYAIRGDKAPRKIHKLHNTKPSAYYGNPSIELLIKGSKALIGVS